MGNFDEFKVHSNKNRNLNQISVQNEIRNMNRNFSVCRYEPEDELSILERKVLNRIDIEFAHKNPDAKVQIFLDTYGKYHMEYSGGSVKINKTCENKEKCFDKLKDFILSIKAMPL